MAACFPGTCIEKTESGEFGGDGKDRREESKGTSETEVPGQPVWFIEEQSKPNTAHQGFRARGLWQRMLANVVDDGTATWHDMTLNCFFSFVPLLSRNPDDANGWVPYCLQWFWSRFFEGVGGCPQDGTDGVKNPWVKSPFCASVATHICTYLQHIFAPWAWVYSTLHHFMVGKWVPATAGKV